MVSLKYRILQSNYADSALAERDILQQVAQRGLTPVRMAFFTDVANNEDYLAQWERVVSLCNEIFAERKPMVVLVAQPPLNARLLAEVTYVEDDCKIVYNNDYIVINDCQIFSGGLFSAQDASIGSKAERVFERLHEILKTEGLAINDIVRQWNYIEHITHISEQGQNYQQFNDARSRFYELTQWQNGYPAATGIGANCGGVVVVIDAIKQSDKCSRAIDNPLQLSAHSYTQKVLIDGQDPQKKTTPKFERARWVGDENQGMIYISGTAAIRGENSLLADVMQQGVVTMENIEHLTSYENQEYNGVPYPAKCEYEMMRVYLKSSDNWQQISGWLKDNYHCEDVAIVVADVCRAELLIEIEGIAKRY